MKQRKWKITLLFSIIIATALFLSGCGVREQATLMLRQAGLLTEEKQRTFDAVSDELDAVGMEKPAFDGFFVLHNGLYYPMVFANWVNNEEYATSYYTGNLEELSIKGHRMGLDETLDMQIPTLFLEQGDTLVYYSQQNVINYYTFTKLWDLGYSLPIAGYTSTVAGYVYVPISVENEKNAYTCSLLPSATKESILSQKRFEADKASASLRIFSINGTPINQDYIQNGILTGLERNVEYQINGAFGSTNYQFTSQANYHYLMEGELYAEADYDSLYDGVYNIPIPDYLTSGYYMMGSGTIFRLVTKGNSYDLYNTDDVQFNTRTLNLDEDYALSHGGKIDETRNNVVVDSQGKIVANSNKAYSKNPILNLYKTAVPGALGYLKDDGNAIATSDPATEDIKDIQELSVGYYKLVLAVDEPGVTLDAGATLYSLTSSLEEAPCMVRQYMDGLVTLPSVRGEEGFEYTSVTNKKQTIKGPIYIALYYTPTANLTFTAKDSRFTITAVEDTSEIPQELLDGVDKTPRRK